MQPPQQPHIILQHHQVMTTDTLPLRLTTGHVVGGVTLQDSEARIITPEEFKAGAIVLPEPWLVRHIIQHPDGGVSQAALQSVKGTAAIGR